MFCGRWPWPASKVWRNEVRQCGLSGAFRAKNFGSAQWNLFNHLSAISRAKFPVRARFSENSRNMRLLALRLAEVSSGFGRLRVLERRGTEYFAAAITALCLRLTEGSGAPLAVEMRHRAAIPGKEGQCPRSWPSTSSLVSPSKSRGVARMARSNDHVDQYRRRAARSKTLAGSRGTSHIRASSLPRRARLARRAGR